MFKGGGDFFLTMKKRLLIFWLFGMGMVMISSIAIAVGDMMGFGSGYGMMSGAGMFGMSLLGLIYLALGAFVFSVIFWLTYKWLVKDKKNMKR